MSEVNDRPVARSCGSAVVSRQCSVAFCRHIKQGIYDVGIPIVVQSKDPIFRSNVPPADFGLDWVAEAMVDTDEPDDIKESA